MSGPRLPDRQSVMTYVDGETATELAEIARRAGVSQSEIMRRAVAEYLNKRRRVTAADAYGRGVEALAAALAGGLLDAANAHIDRTAAARGIDRADAKDEYAQLFVDLASAFMRLAKTADPATWARAEQRDREGETK